jgi:hypothetical protein
MYLEDQYSFCTAVLSLEVQQYVTACSGSQSDLKKDFSSMSASQNELENGLGMLFPVCAHNADLHQER